MFKRSLFLIFIFTFSLHTYAEPLPSRVLPHHPGLRENGVHQIGDSCIPASLLTGLEHSFQRLDKPVKLSLSYFVFSLKIMADMAGMRLMPDLNYLTDDSYKELQAEKGWLLPSYMLPDEHEYSHLSIKSNLAMLPNPSFAGSCVKFGEKAPKLWTAMVSPEHSFFAGKDILNTLKQMVNSNQVFSFLMRDKIGEIIFPDIQGKIGHRVFKRGFSKEPHILGEEALAQITKLIEEHSKTKEEINHAFAVVGYDDKLYPHLRTPGAFIVKGTWDETSVEYSTLPYQFVMAMSKVASHRLNDKNGDNFLTLIGLEISSTFYSDFYQKYEQCQPSTAIFNVPYFLNRNEAITAAVQYLETNEHGSEEDLKNKVDELNMRSCFIAKLATPQLASMFLSHQLTQAFAVSQQDQIYPDLDHYKNQPGGPDFGFLFLSPASLSYWDSFFTLVLSAFQQDANKAKNDL